MKKRIILFLLAAALLASALPAIGVTVFAEQGEGSVDYIPGDANGDGSVNGKDITLIRRYNAGYAVTMNYNAANVNGDEVLNGKDVTAVRRHNAGYDVTLLPSPVEIIPTVPVGPEQSEPEFPEADFEGADFVTYMRTRSQSYGAKYITPTDDLSDFMEKATYDRNLAVEDKYNVKLVSKTANEPTSEFDKLFASGDVDFDVMLDRRSTTAVSAQAGHLYDWNRIDNITWDSSWWDENVKEGYSTGGKLYFAVNDVSIGNLTGARFLYFNQAMINEFDLEHPYELVENNGWTLDKFLSMVKSVSLENGDGTWNGLDRYGMLSETGSSNGNFLYLLMGAGVEFIETDSEGKLFTNAYSSKVEQISDKLREVFINTHYVCDYDAAVEGLDREGLSKYEYARQRLFTADHFLFVQNGLGVSTGFKDMQSDYGIAPNPKADPSQDRYYHKIDRFALIWSIPASDTVDYGRLGTVMDYWSYESSKTVIPAYYDTTLNTKKNQNPQDLEMLQLIKSSIVYNLSDLYCNKIASTVYSGYVDDSLAEEWSAAQNEITRQLKELNRCFADPMLDEEALQFFLEDNYAAGLVSDEVNLGVLALLSSLEYFNDRMVYGSTELGERWVYSNKGANVKQTGYFDDMLNTSKKGGNCASPVNWALTEMGIVPSDDRFYGGSTGNFASYSGNARTYLAPYCEIIDMHSDPVPFKTLYKEGKVKAGDIFLCVHHTFVYRGDESFYAAGHDGAWHTESDAPTEDERKAVFDNWVLTFRQVSGSGKVSTSSYNSNYNYDVHYIVRLKDNYIPSYYRDKDGTLVSNPMIKD